mmetsp:Transcript_9572/g.28581  ORF Transcript_9572/g.28581 Transcript_9572/m.28581 type:complete len:526 (-) Transcript_9572:222-1799(-)
MVPSSPPESTERDNKKNIRLVTTGMGRTGRYTTMIRKELLTALATATIIGAAFVCLSSSGSASSSWLTLEWFSNDKTSSSIDLPQKYVRNSNTDRRRRLTAEDQEKAEDDDFVINSKKQHYPLFSISDEFNTMGPTVFPKPSYVYDEDVPNDSDLVVYLQPTSGKHRSDEDSVFVFAAEYTFDTYMLFLMSLYETGFKGDVVFGISKMDWENKDIRELLEYWDNSTEEDEMTVVVYVVPYHCYNVEGEVQESHRGGMRVCKCNNMFGHKNKSTGEITPLLDKRHGRTAQTIRYELYWIWSECYDPTSWILLIDARDTIFQETPFGRVPRRTVASSSNNGDGDDDGGLLIFFGENADATSLGKSKYNRRWLSLAYGERVAAAFADKPTICSGSTMGEQLSIDAYLRAEVAESDESKTVIFGADQGFHNYLYYSNKLANAKAINQIIVQDQGLGIVNNMGALRDKSLEEWGNGRIIQDTEEYPKNTVFNWDGTISPVVHQYDRHKVLANWWHRRKLEEFEEQWEKMK